MFEWSWEQYYLVLQCVYFHQRHAADESARALEIKRPLIVTKMETNWARWHWGRNNYANWVSPWDWGAKNRQSEWEGPLMNLRVNTRVGGGGGGGVCFANDRAAAAHSRWRLDQQWLEIAAPLSRIDTHALHPRPGMRPAARRRKRERESSNQKAPLSLFLVHPITHALIYHGMDTR